MRSPPLWSLEHSLIEFTGIKISQQPRDALHTKTPSSETFGHGTGKAVARRDTSPSAGSVSSVTSISSVSASPPPSRYAPSLASRSSTPSGTWVMATPPPPPRRSSQAGAGSSSQSSSRQPRPTQSRPIYFGYHTDRCVKKLGFTPATCHTLVQIVEENTIDQWLAAIKRRIPELPEGGAELLLDAIRTDLNDEN